MPQHDYDLANQAGAAFRADLNSALAAIASQNSGATAPNPAFAYQMWADTTTGILKQRNAANSAWIDLLSLTGSVTGAGRSLIQAADTAAQRTTLGIDEDGLFFKADPAAVAFTKTGAGTASIKAGTKIWRRDGAVQTFASDTTITMPTLTAGTDYAIYVCNDASIRADASFTAPSGYTTANARKIGGFHYAPGENATGTSGGNTTPAINAYSLWDLKFRPSCPDPRGMTLVADAFWSDIYLLGAEHLTNGTSKYNVTIADGASPPKKPLKFGGNGSTTQADGNWWNMNEVLQSHGKRPPAYDEFAALAYGTTEATSSGGTDVPTTGATGTGATSAWNIFTSKWGAIQAAGCLWTWGDEFGGGAAAAAWTANTGGRGSTYQMENAALFGGNWGSTSFSGSRASNWSASPAGSSDGFGVRGVCDHLMLD